MMNIASVALTALMTVDLLAVPTAPASFDEYSSGQGAGILQVSMQPAGGDSSFALGATRVPLLVLNLSASCDADIRIDEIAVKRVGLGSSSDLEGVYFMDETRRLSRVVTFDSVGDARVRMTGVTIPKCGSVRMTAMVNVLKTAAAGSEHALTITAASGIRSGAKTVKLIRQTEEFTIKASPQQSGSIRINFLSVPGRLRYGRIETVARLQVSADSKTDHLIRSITLTNEENARDFQLINLYIESSRGEQLTNVLARMRGKQVTFEFEPSLVLKRGQTLVLPVKAEVRGSNGVKVRFILEETSDVDAREYRSR